MFEFHLFINGGFYNKKSKMLKRDLGGFSSPQENPGIVFTKTTKKLLSLRE